MTTTERQYEMVPTTGPHSPERDAPLDAVFDAVGDRECRTLLRHLAETDGGPVAVEDLAERLAESDATGRTTARLHHTLLPKLADAGFLDYDADDRTVRYRSDRRLEAVLSTLDRGVEESPVSLDALLDALSAFRRRRALVTLLTHGDLPLADLADEVAVGEYDRPLPEIDAETVLEVYLSLYHTHVPKLADAGLVEYDQQGDFVALTDAAAAVEPRVRALCDHGE
ncbi:ArsR family transcriptional regulator [Halorussus salilacus]|uniref:ArsR/SmtB family transcription factor n=1 Tax=Halorussus salilacus TaxID=2953750 RepID=UPI00209FF723|nr:helix-turn-helix transcriptional regulator [Halorussus salilacus]USZ67869.1 ArsR family transcriptional regulator [Halorussus salilacus]